MKVAALILGILGGLSTAGLGAKWVTDYEANKENIKSLASLGGQSMVADALAQVEALHRAGLAMTVLGLLAIVAAALVFKLSKPAGGVMILAAVVPAIFAPSSLIASFLLILAGVFALVARNKPAAIAPVAVPARAAA